MTAPGPSVDGFSGRQTDAASYKLPGMLMLLASRGPGFGHRFPPAPALWWLSALSGVTWGERGRGLSFPEYTGPLAVWRGLPTSPCLPGVAGEAAANPSEAAHQV